MKTIPGWLYLPFGVLIGLITGAVVLLIARQPVGNPVTLEPQPTPAPIIVHVDGAVNAPGVYPFEIGSRAQQAIDRAGGFTTDANPTSINLAALLIDGQKIYVPKQGEPTQQIQAGANPTSGEIVNLNTAPLELLTTLPGIGEERAKAIIKYREDRGGFKSIEELQNIDGIGPATFEKLKDRITVAVQP